jgi:hypothetical protein
MTQQQINYTTSPRHHFTPSVNTVERYHQRRTIKAALLEQENCRNAHLCSLPRPSSYPTYSTPFQNAQENYIAEWEQKQNDRFNIEKKRIMQKREESRKRKVEREEHQKKITMSIIKRRQEIILREMTNLNLIFAQSQRESQSQSLAVEEDLDVLNLEILPSLTFDEDDLPFEDEEESNELFDALEILSAKTFDEDEDEADERDDEEGDSAEFEVNVRTLMPSEDEWVNLVIKSSKTFDEDDEDDEEGKGKNEGHDELSIVEQDVLSPSSSHSLVLQDSTIHNRFSTVAIDRQY